MDVITIPFAATVGMVRTEQGALMLPFGPSVLNHLGGVHASAQFALAETASGEALQRVFPDLAGKVVPVLRDSRIKFRKPAASDLVALPSVAADEAARFRDQFERKQRATITVEVEVRDANSVVTSAGSFEWFVQGIPQGAE